MVQDRVPGARIDFVLDEERQALLDHAVKPIDDRFAQMLESYRDRLAGVTSVGGKLRRLADIRSEEGYMAQVQRDGDGWLLTENHCPICAAATRCRGFCRNELALFRAVLGEGVSVERVEYLLESGERCAYSVRA